MRSLLSLSATRSRRGLAVLAAVLATLTTGCEFITGVPKVVSVDVSLSPNDSLPARAQGQAIAAVHGKGDRNLTNSSKISIGFESSNPAVATVNASSGALTTVSEGTTIITATARGVKGSATLVVTQEIPVRVDAPPPTVHLNERVQLVITPIGATGQALGKRAVTITSTNTNVVTVETDNTTTGTFVKGVTVGQATVTGSVQGVPFNTVITVQPPSVAKVTGALQKGKNELLETESNQIAVSLFAADNAPISTAGQTITYSSNDQTVATVNPQSGVVTGVRQGTTTIDIAVAGTSARGSVAITVLPIPAKEIRFGNRAPFIRLGSNGTGVPSSRVAVPADSLGRAILNRQVQYKSTDPSVFSVTSLGTVVGQKLGQALLIASVDNGAVADTIKLTVTPVPIAVVQVLPIQANITAGQTQRFTATLTDSLGVTVSGRPITWTSSNSVAVPVDQTGLVTGVSAATAVISAITDAVPGLPGSQIGQAQVLVLPIPIATIDVQPTTVTLSLRSSPATVVSVTPRDANGAALFGRTANISVQSDDPSVASGDAQGNIRGFKQGTAKLTYQALDQNLQPQGQPTVVIVTVTQ
ncbi:Ig domain protein group 2 domain protein [Gemmatirosa kalamazoonensis]|uniref:Ig domain protein group 2 domain protein n=1 Tax=Gemmatirosa kalamazoonensis TaxID=861299 RepID=W0RHR7_9BACT|nr:Ig-like domain-containing protein [Gemmatirosa kalamazoonensis]AHG89870.1 Ig domain protein group 2 domain protein [Gemmatirosa kalamazoonensis]